MIENQKIFYRKELESGSEIELGGIIYTIDRIVGDGGSTIVYEASYEDSLTKGYFHKVLIKELYPVAPNGLIWRDEKGWIRWHRSMDSFMEDRKICFQRGNKINLKLLEKNPFTASGNMNSYEAYGTYYSIVSIHKGEILQASMLKKGKLGIEEALKITKYILDAVEVFHDNHLLHLDVSPDNILLLAGQALLIDYNSTWNMEDEEEECFFSFKEGYCCPEIILKCFDQVGYQSDIFSVGAILFEMLTGKKFSILKKSGKFQSNSNPESESSSKVQTIAFVMDLEDLDSILQECISLIDIDISQKEEFSVKIEQLLRKALHIIPRKRFQSTVEFREAIDEIFVWLEDAKERKRDHLLVVSKKRFKRVSKITAGILAVGLAIGGGYFGREDIRHPRVKQAGNTNSNIYSQGKVSAAEDGSVYYVDVDGKLYMRSYDKETKKLGADSQLIYPQTEVDGGGEVAFVNISEDKLYFMDQGDDGYGETLICADKDGSNPQRLIEYSLDGFVLYDTYVKLSNGKEYIYYIYSEDYEYASGYIYRYNIATKKAEKVLEESTAWFNIYGDSIYYSARELTLKDEMIDCIKKADLSGKNREVIDIAKGCTCGIVEDNSMLMFNMDESTILQYDLDDIVGSEKLIRSFGDTYLGYVQISYDDGYIFYSTQGENALHKFSIAEAEEDKVIQEA